MPGLFDIFVAYKFIKLLTTPWKKTDAFKLGIIDNKGKILKKRDSLKTDKEKKAYTSVHSLVWNLKKLLDKLPGGKTRLGSFATALWLLKEEYGYTNNTLLEKTFLSHIGEDRYTLDESFSELLEHKIDIGEYMTTSDSHIYDFMSCKDSVEINSEDPLSVVLGTAVYEGIHRKTGKRVVVSNEELLRIN